MSNVSMECLIKSYQVFSNLFTIVEPVIKNDNPTIISFSNYVRSFCLDMIVRCDSTNPELRYFVNNLTLIALPEMDAEEYKYATTKYTSAHYDTYLFSEQPITKKILDYDKANGTHIMNDFCSQLCLIANIFSSLGIFSATAYNSDNVFQNLKNVGIVPSSILFFNSII